MSFFALRKEHQKPDWLQRGFGRKKAIAYAAEKHTSNDEKCC